MKQEILERIINGQKSLIVSGDISSGKTLNILFPIVSNIIKNDESLFILDSKEEYINEYYEILRENDYNVVVINLRDMDKSDGFNPLEYPYKLYNKGKKDEALEYIERIGKTIFYNERGNDPFWTSSALNFFEGITLSLFEDGLENEINFNSIYNMFNSMDVKYGVTDYLSKYFDIKGRDSSAYNLVSSTILAPKETRGGILSVAKQKLMLYITREKLSMFLNHTSFNLEDALNKKTAIIFINKDENKLLNSIVSIFIEQLYNILISKKINKKFNFVLDNFDSIELLNELDNMLESCISRNVKFYIGTRSMDRLIQNYSGYIDKLCSLVTIENLKMSVDGKVTTDIMDAKEKTMENQNIAYPNLNKNDIRIFDIQKYVRDNAKNIVFDDKKFEGNVFDDNYTHSTDDLIKRIDDKLEQIDKDEFEDIKKNMNVKDAEIQKYKIDEG